MDSKLEEIRGEINEIKNKEKLLMEQLLSYTDNDIQKHLNYKK